MTQERNSTIIDEDAHYEIRDLRKRCGKIRPEETTSGKKPCDIEIKQKRRSAVSFTEHKIECLDYACQVCFVLDGLYNCTICKRFTCIRANFPLAIRWMRIDASFSRFFLRSSARSYASLASRASSNFTLRFLSASSIASFFLMAKK